MSSAEPDRDRVSPRWVALYLFATKALRLRKMSGCNVLRRVDGGQILRPEAVASIHPGATIRVVDESSNTPGQGQSIADFVHSLPSKKHSMNVTFEDRLGERRMRNFAWSRQRRTQSRRPLR